MRILVSAPLIVLCAVGGAHAQQFFSASDGTVSFSKAARADFTDPANIDFITPTVAFTRADVQGLFNPLQEAGSSGGVGPSPAGTLWNIGGSVQDVIDGTIDLTDFEPWVAAIEMRPLGTIGVQSVVYSIDDDAYFDLTLTEWGVGNAGGGSFAYTRAVVNVIPEPGAALLLAFSAAGVFGFRRQR